jgi:hypothetical protein
MIGLEVWLFYVPLLVLDCCLFDSRADAQWLLRSVSSNRERPALRPA